MLIAIAAIVSAWVAHERRQSQREFQIAEQLDAVGAIVWFAGPYDIVEIPTDEQSWWRSVAGRILGPRVQGIHTQLSNADDLARLAQLTIVSELWFSCPNVDDLLPLAGLKNLQVLWVDCAQVSDLSPLSGLNKLRWLKLEHIRINELFSLKALLDLETLVLSDCQFSNLSPLSELESLRFLHFEGVDVTDQQLKSLNETLPNCRVTRD